MRSINMVRPTLLLGALTGALVTIPGLAMPFPSGGKQRQVASPFKFSATPVGYRFSGARLGQHSDEVLAAAGFTAAEIAKMRAAGIVA